VVGSTDHLEWLCLLERCDKSWLGRIVIHMNASLGILNWLDLSSELMKLIRAPGIQLIILCKDDAVLQATVDLLNSL